MKHLAVITILILGFMNPSFTQDSSKRLKIYRTWVLSNNGSPVVRGALYDVKDSSILISNSIDKHDYSANNFDTEKIYVKNIRVIKVREKNKVWKSTLVGALTGAALGGALGFASGDDGRCSSGELFCFRYDAEEKAVMGGIAGGLLGSGLGVLLGHLKLEIPINGNKEMYGVYKSKLKKMAIVKE